MSLFLSLSRVITREADLVTAHEFGHNWGSEHDPDVPECSPSAGPSAEGEHSGTSGSFSDPQL